MISREQMLKCLDREIKMRHGVYSKRVQRGEMRPDQAKYEVDTMLAIREHIAVCPQLDGQLSLTALPEAKR